MMLIRVIFKLTVSIYNTYKLYLRILLLRSSIQLCKIYNDYIYYGNITVIYKSGL